jgi:hypothetical protein
VRGGNQVENPLDTAAGVLDADDVGVLRQLGH